MFFLALFFHWLWRRFKRPRLIAKPKNEPAQPILYELQDNVLPKITGKLLVWFVRLTDSIIGKWLIIPNMLRRANLFMLRKFKMQETPTFYPLVLRDSETSCTSFKTSVKESDRASERFGSTGFRFTSIVDYSEAYRSGKANPIAVAETVLRAIATSDEGTKPLRAFVQINEDEVKRMAAEAAKRFEEGKALSVFDGVPVGVKEQMLVKSYHLRCGTVFLGKEVSTSDATLVDKLRSAGAIIIGITNMHELGIGTLGNNPNRFHGTARNPYDLSHYTGGSSSGSAAAVAAGLVPLTLGTDGGGSLRIPSTLCGVVTLKATFGRLSGAGLSLLSPTLGHIGPICSCVSDVALAYDLLAGPDPNYPPGLCQPAVEECSNLLKSGSLSGLKIGIHPEYFKHADKEVVNICQKVVEQLSEQGAEVIDIEIAELEEARVAHLVTILSEMASFLSSEREENGGLMNPDVQVNLAGGSQLTTVDYLMAQQQRTRAIGFLKELFSRVDCIITPGCPMTAPPIDEKSIEFGESDTYTSGKLMRYAFLGNLTGVPCMTLPVGYDSRDLPIGLQIMSKWWDEQLIFRVAFAVERLVETKKPMVHYSIL